jgi:hypothetical protein
LYFAQRRWAAGTEQFDPLAELPNPYATEEKKRWLFTCVSDWAGLFQDILRRQASAILLDCQKHIRV